MSVSHTTGQPEQSIPQVNMPPSVDTLQPTVSNNDIQDELKHAKADAEQTLTALLQFAEGVRSITRQMERATQSNAETEESEDDVSAVITPESVVNSTCLQGTTFGTDLMRLLDASLHVREYARLTIEEAAVSAQDVVEAQQTAKDALARAATAEALAHKLAKKSVALHKQNTRLNAEKRVLAREVQALRRHVTMSRQTDMERLLQQHVVGALLVHEGQLKAAAQEQQSQLKQRRQRQQREMEEEKKEDFEDEFGMINAEDCPSEGSVSRDEKADAKSVKGTNVASEKGQDNGDSTDATTRATKDATVEQAPASEIFSAFQEKNPLTDLKSATSNNHKDSNNVVVIEKNQENGGAVTKSTANDMGKISAPDSISSAPSYTPVKLFAGFDRHLSVQPAPEPQHKSDSTATVNEQPTSSRSISSSSSSSSQTHQTYPMEREHVGSKVFNFLFYPEKKGEQRFQQQRETEQGQQPSYSVDGAHQQQPYPQRMPTRMPQNMLSPLLQLDDGKPDDEKDSVSVDGTIPTLAATATPTSSCSASRARTVSVDNSTKRTTTASVCTSNHPYKSFPKCVTYSDDNVSIDSNLNSPSLQPSPKNSKAMTSRPIIDVEEVIASASRTLLSRNSPSGERAVGLYKDLKVFQSLAIPTAHDIDDYCEDRDNQEIMLKHQFKPSAEEPKEYSN